MHEFMKKLILTLIFLLAPFLAYAHGGDEAVGVTSGWQFMSRMMNYMAQLNTIALITYFLVWIVLILLIATLLKWLFKK